MIEQFMVLVMTVILFALFMLPVLIVNSITGWWIV